MKICKVCGRVGPRPTMKKIQKDGTTTYMCVNPTVCKDHLDKLKTSIKKN